MKCPRCNSGVSLFSPSINRGRLRNKCPHCAAPVRFNIRHKKTLLLTLGVAVVVPMVVAPTVSPVYGSLLVAVGSLAAAGVGIVALIRFELISGEPQGKDQA